jgi:glycolate oxidase FAD binding subunit
MSVIQVSSVAELAAVVGEAARDRTQVLAVGGGSHGGGADAGEEQRVSLSEHLRSVVAYDPAELVVTVDAGLAVEELDAALAEHGQEWGADILPGSTVGGAIASGASSLRRFATGPLRDSVLGLELVDGRGRTIRVGGRTVKNSTGLDLVRLMVGSRGTLGVITRAHVRVRPRPRVQAVVRARDVELGSAIAAARQAGVLGAALADRASVQFLLEGWRDDVTSNAARLVQQLGGEIDDSADRFLAERPWAAWPAAVLLTVRPSALEPLAARSGTRWAALLSTGHLWVGGDCVAELLAIARAAVETGGHATLVSEPCWPALREGTDQRDDTDIGVRIKAAFDPDGVFPSPTPWIPA